MLRVGNTHNICFEFSTIYTNTLEDLFHFDEETRMKYGTCELDVAEVPWALCHTLATGCALEVAVDGAHTWILKTTFFRTLGRLVHYLGKLNLGDRVRFNFLWGENTKLDLFNLTDWGSRKGELSRRHG